MGVQPSESGIKSDRNHGFCANPDLPLPDPAKPAGPGAIKIAVT
jgi:hypothetical protein